MSRSAELAREREPDTYVPFIGHAAPGVLLLDDGSLLAMLRLDGMAFETTDPREINARHAQRNILLRNLASDRLVLTTHVVRTLADGCHVSGSAVLQRFRARAGCGYRQRLLSNRLFRNELFLSVVLRAAGASGVADGSVAVAVCPSQARRPRSRGLASQLDAIAAITATLLHELGALRCAGTGAASRERHHVFGTGRSTAPGAHRRAPAGAAGQWPPGRRDLHRPRHRRQARRSRSAGPAARPSRRPSACGSIPRRPGPACSTRCSAAPYRLVLTPDVRLPGQAGGAGRHDAQAEPDGDGPRQGGQPDGGADALRPTCWPPTPSSWATTT